MKAIRPTASYEGLRNARLTVLSYLPSYSLPPLWTSVFEGRCQVYAETGLRGDGKDRWAEQWDRVLAPSQGWVEGSSVCVVPVSTSSRTLVPRPQLSQANSHSP